MSDLVTYLINLDDSTDRLAFADEQLRKAGLDYERFPAVDTRGKDPLSFPEYDDRAARFWYGRSLRGGELGCYFSHLRVLERFLETDKDFALIVEDDAIYAPNFKKVLDHLLQFFRDNPDVKWDALNFADPVPAGYTRCLHQFRVDGWPERLDRAFLFPLTTHCILWSREGAQAFLAEGQRIWKPVDHSMRHVIVRRGRGLCMSRTLAIQADAASVIDDTPDGGREAGETRWYWFNVWRIKRAEKPIAKRFRRRYRRARRRGIR